MKAKTGIHRYYEERPWGSFTQFISNTPATVKLITVAPKQSLSLQYHAKRREFWHVLSGDGTVVLGTKKHTAKEGEEFIIEKGVTHRMRAGSKGLIILEIATGRFDESDIVRLEDAYGRAKKRASPVSQKKRL